MKYLLDTNICVHFLRGQFNILDKLIEVGVENCAISEITLAELVYGAEKSSKPRHNHELINKFISQMSIIPIFEAINLYAKEKVRLQIAGKSISDFDLLIGCTAIENNLIMVTENLQEFERLNRIVLENWVQRSLG